MRAFKYSSQYETTFSLMNNNPENMKMDWEIRDAVNSYLSLFLKEVSVVSNFTIDSQVHLEMHESRYRKLIVLYRSKIMLHYH